MKNCPTCGANIDGLTHHCDCCGALLYTMNSFFIWHTFVTQASGDLYVYMREIFHKFDGIDYSKYQDILQTVEVNVFCYPDTIIEEQGIKNRHYFSAARKKVSLKVVLDYNAYVNCDRNLKKELLSTALKTSFMNIRKRCIKHSKNLDQLFNGIILSL